MEFNLDECSMSTSKRTFSSNTEDAMPIQKRDTPYNFDAFLNWRSTFDYYRDDPFLQKVVQHFAGAGWQQVDQAARGISQKVSFRWRFLADEAAKPKNHPTILHYDAHNHRIDRIVRPMETLIMEREVLQEALFSEDTGHLERLIKMFLIFQNGEACIACPLTCTEGLVAILEAFAKTPETEEILLHCKEGKDGDFGIGAQYLTEIQGGSDLPANLLEAVLEGDDWKLYGTKFFCSATHADYAVVTAKPRGSDDIGVFLVPSWLPGNKEKEIRNGIIIDRLKWKMGTSELTTAEITFNGAVAYPIGPFDRGLANVVGIVLTYSRLAVGLSGAASMTRAAREAAKYSEFREAFGQKIGHFPMLASQITDLENHARRSTAAAFKIYQQFFQLDGKLKLAINPDDPPEIRCKRFDVRELVMLQKITSSWDAVDQLRKAMSIFGGHGVIEDFSVLPRLYRDAAVNELWEGPRNVLLNQIYRDLMKVGSWYAPADFVRSILAGADSELVANLAEEIETLLVPPNLNDKNTSAITMCKRWDEFCHRLFHAYQDHALTEVFHSGVGLHE
jgi:alkylation response protein AidB-like acyl-CoA dehydrogenase